MSSLIFSTLLNCSLLSVPGHHRSCFKSEKKIHEMCRPFTCLYWKATNALFSFLSTFLMLNWSWLLVNLMASMATRLVSFLPLLSCPTVPRLLLDPAGLLIEDDPTLGQLNANLFNPSLGPEEDGDGVCMAGGGGSSWLGGRTKLSPWLSPRS